jgi:uncharacterized protein YifE (UPF0438 family)
MAVKRRTFPFEFKCSTDVFPADELAALWEHGGRLEALAAGTIPPESPADKRFLKVDRGEAEAETLLERAWDRLKGRREFEREQAEAAPKEPAQDYGITEFDHDRCWW